MCYNKLVEISQCSVLLSQNYQSIGKTDWNRLWCQLKKKKWPFCMWGSEVLYGLQSKSVANSHKINVTAKMLMAVVFPVTPMGWSVNQLTCRPRNWGFIPPKAQKSLRAPESRPGLIKQSNFSAYSVKHPTVKECLRWCCTPWNSKALKEK